MWLLAAVITSGTLSPYPYVAVTRLHPVILPLVLLAGLMTTRLLDAVPPLLARYGWGAKFRTGAIAACITALAVMVLTLNAVRFWSTTPEVFHHHRAAVAVGAWRSDACGAAGVGAVFVGRDAGLVQTVIASYDPGGPLPRFLTPEEVESAASLDGGTLRCVVFIDPEDQGRRRWRRTLAASTPMADSPPFPTRRRSLAWPSSRAARADRAVRGAPGL